MKLRKIRNVEEILSRKYRCNTCKQTCDIEIIDTSFVHAFGVEHSYDIVSKCCESQVTEMFPLKDNDYYDQE